MEDPAPGSRHPCRELIEKAVYGCTIEEAGASKLAETIADLELEGRSRNALEVVRLLVSACQMGLHTTHSI